MMRGRPVTRKKVSEILRAEGYNPEEIAARLIPDYAPVSSFMDEPASQPLGNSKSDVPPQATQSPVIEPQTPKAASVSPLRVPNQNTDMPPSSPPSPSPSPQHTPIAHQLENMSIDEPERGNMGTYSDMLVPVSSPPANNNKSISTPGSTRSSRGKRRSSFIEMSSSPPPDEFSAPRKQPLPESPSIDVMIAEREKGFRDLARERQNLMVAERERELRRADKAADKNQRAGSPPRGAPNIIRFGRGRGRGRGRGLTLSTTIPLGTPRARAPAPLLSPPGPVSASQDGVDKLMSQYTHADSDEDVHGNLIGNLGGGDWGLQTQAPYVQTQESFGDSEVSGSRGGSQLQNASQGSHRR
ncbi:hypothetical protein OPQ81_010951 [Rhizoctonia solani]|nr:hypothetical protein OPQ81_010951 [Rhizoctonia solani]